MKKRISCIVLSLLLVLCFVPTTVMAIDGEPNNDTISESKLTFFSLTIKPILGSTVGVVPDNSGVASQFLKWIVL